MLFVKLERVNAAIQIGELENENLLCLVGTVDLASLKGVTQPLVVV